MPLESGDPFFFRISFLDNEQTRTTRPPVSQVATERSSCHYPKFRVSYCSNLIVSVVLILSTVYHRVKILANVSVYERQRNTEDTLMKIGVKR